MFMFRFVDFLFFLFVDLLFVWILDFDVCVCNPLFFFSSFFQVRTLRLVAGKTADTAVAASKEMNNKKRPISRSSRASLQV